MERGDYDFRTSYVGMNWINRKKVGAHDSPLDSIPDFYTEVQGSNPRELRKIFSKEILFSPKWVHKSRRKIT